MSESPFTHRTDDPGTLDLEDRSALRRVQGLSTELEDITEVEYRQVRLERVVLVGVWTTGTVTDAENSLRELAALAETAGADVMDGVIQRRDKPDACDVYRVWQGARAARHRDRACGADTVICDGELTPGPAHPSRGRRQGQGRRPHLADPRHLRAAREEP